MNRYNKDVDNVRKRKGFAMLCRLLEVLIGGAFGLFLLGYFFVGSVAESWRCWLGWKDLATNVAGWMVFAVAAFIAFPFYNSKYIVTAE